MTTKENFRLGCRHGQIDKECSLSQKITSRHTKKIHALKVEILLYLMIHMKINFHFTIITLKDDHFHVDLSRFYKIASTCK
jgi:hypothetical protein